MLRALLAVALFAMPALAADEEGFQPLFNGQDLTGWEKHGGGATYRVEEGMIVGEVGPGPNSFLCTEKTYGDFILKLELKFDVPGNSGVQVRSHIRPEGDRVFGYQVEIDPSDRAWSGGIYDEGRRGWLYPLKDKEEARRAFQRDDWNEYVVQCVGPSIKTWVNGVPAADLLDDADLEGLIALQVHSGSQGRIRWRNIRLKELGRSAFAPLLSGEDLAGWRKIGGGQWALEDGVLHGTHAAADPEHGHLITEKSYGDFSLRLRFKSNQGNSGVYFRVEEGGGAGVLGFQAEVDPQNDVGGLYETGGRGWVVQPTAEQVASYFKPAEWNEMSVTALGDRVEVYVNGKRSAQLQGNAGKPQGFIALQLHGGQDVDVQFKDLEILEIPPLPLQ